MLSHAMIAPRWDEATSTYVFYAPLGDGALPMIALDDLGEYARWIFDHPDTSAGINLEASSLHVRFDEVARAFTKVTGHKARYQDVPFKQYFDSFVREDASSSHQVSATEPGVLTFRESFTGWWNVWRHSGGDNPVIKRDYALLDKVRVSSLS